MSVYDELLQKCMAQPARQTFDWHEAWDTVMLQTCGIAREDPRFPWIASALVDCDRAYQYRDVEAFLNLSEIVIPRIVKGAWNHADLERTGKRTD